MNRNIKKIMISLALFLFSLAVLSAQVYLNPGQSTTIQAEAASLSRAEIESEHSGYTGSAYVNYINEAGSYIQWAVNVSAAGPANCVFIFANGGAARPVDVAVNGSVVTRYSFPGTGGWSSWTSASVAINLAGGNNTIRLTSAASEGGPNIDRMDITFNGSGSSSGTNGDVNDDGSINIVDALMTAQYYVGLNPSPFARDAADVNCDSSINIIDALMIAQYYVGLINSFSACATPQPIPTPLITPTKQPSHCYNPVTGQAINHGVKLVGYGAGTTGGGGSNKKTVSSKSQLESAIGSNTTIYVNGTISGSDMISIKDVSNISIIGQGSNGKFRGIGLSFVRTNNIIIQNLFFENCSDDAINIENTNRAWVDHNTFSTSVNWQNCDSGSVKDQFDGQIDIKKNTENVTVSFNYIHDACKAMLLGFSDGKEPDNHVTYHHNRFENIGSRLPLIRSADTHVYNNYYKNVLLSGINVRMGANALIENNFFFFVDDPILSADSDKIGYWNVSGNLYAPDGPTYTHHIEDVDVIGEVVNCEVKSTSSWKVNYSYTLDDAKDVPATVIKYAGAGKM